MSLRLLKSLEQIPLDPIVALVGPEAYLFATIWFAGIKVEASGVVRRVEAQSDGSFGLGVAFDRYRVLLGASWTVGPRLGSLDHETTV